MKDAEKLNLWIEKTARQRLEILAGEARQSLTAYVESMIDERFDQRALKVKEAVGPRSTMSAAEADCAPAGARTSVRYHNSAAKK